MISSTDSIARRTPCSTESCSGLFDKGHHTNSCRGRRPPVGAWIQIGDYVTHAGEYPPALSDQGQMKIVLEPGWKLR